MRLKFNGVYRKEKALTYPKGTVGAALRCFIGFFPEKPLSADAALPGVFGPCTNANPRSGKG
jgi:hypothetical protein